MTFPSGRLLRNISIAVRPVVRNGWYSDTSMTRSPPAGRLSSAYKNFLFENPPFCPSLQGKTMRKEGLMRVHN
jgi:hypothetical protein